MGKIRMLFRELWSLRVSNLDKLSQILGWFVMVYFVH